MSIPLDHSGFFILRHRSIHLGVCNLRYRSGVIGVALLAGDRYNLGWLSGGRMTVPCSLIAPLEYGVH